VSRVGRNPIQIPDGVEVKIDGPDVRVKGPRGELARSFQPEMQITLEEGVLRVVRPSDEPKVRSLHGLTRALLNNMVVGVSAGFTKALEIEGVGYRPEKDGEDLVLYVGYSHPVRFSPPLGVTFEVDTRARSIKITGHDKEVVGQLAADIRKVRPPEPYKGKGIRYAGEHVRRKAGKAGRVT
jgi:large subunit ribosomal protein L6